VAKLLVTLGFTALVSSFPARAVFPLAPFVAYPVLLALVGGIPARLMARRLAVILPFAVLLGAANPQLDHTPSLIIGGVSITRGWMSLAGIVLRALLIVSAALSLTALTGFDGICGALERLGLPRGFVLQLRLMFRHLSTLSEEVSRTLLAYGLRGGRARGVAPREWGSVAGSILVRSIDRAERIHAAMLARDGGHGRREPGAWLARPSDWLFTLAWMAWFLLCRLLDLPAIVGSLARSLLHV
jgi:cobalt/nickel transport system permease protein